MARPMRYSDEINDKLIKWMNETGYNIVQINGQRISTSPHTDRRPSRGCEVFVGKIPRDCYEDELFPVFQTVGEVHELRLMMMFSGTNRGYAFVMYERLQDAQRAVHQLDNFEIRRGHRIGVLECVNNCRLFIGCFESAEHSEAHLQEIVRGETEHVVSVSRRGGRGGRWYLLVEYSNHRAAAIARRQLTPRRVQLFGPRAVVDWEIPLDKLGRKLALDQRRGHKGPPMLKLYKPLGNLHIANTKVHGKLNWFMEKPKKQMLAFPQPSGAYQDIWLQNQPNKQPPFWPTDVLQSTAFNQSQRNCSGWYSDTQAMPRPHIQQDGCELGSKSYFSKGFNTLSQYSENRTANDFCQLLKRSNHSLMHSCDSGMYTDSSCRRPPSPESSGSARSSFSLSNWEGSTISSSSTGSSGRCTLSWDQSPPSDMTDSSHSDGESQQMLKESSVLDSMSQSPPWPAEKQSSLYMDINDNKSGIWSSRFQSQEDHELIHNLFNKEDMAFTTSSPEYEEMSSSLRALTLKSYYSELGFGRAVQRPQAQYPVISRGSHDTSNLRKVF